jgi:hypothetical protein
MLRKYQCWLVLSFSKKEWVGKGQVYGSLTSTQISKNQFGLYNCSSKKIQRTSSRTYPETTGSLKIFKNLEPAVTLL